ncbi:hypothetical protein E2562_005418 [Oryza meyeriana var. granulata]|uniref:rRNA methyltransferase 2, mitochondrial n=1 Tax=Oryza meyeriana var. granulata TaxID=110450 RepID=A0A6G1DF07_9ORYZ|nr:hypothetical protein E2562_005418 [Oryza meyeriana var. granulata]
MSGASGTADFFYREAQRLGYVARSAFKVSAFLSPRMHGLPTVPVSPEPLALPSQLIQIQKQHKLIAPGAAVLDLGCAPGAWLQVACQNLGPLEKGGVVVGVDVKKVKVPSAHCDSRVRTVCADVMGLMKQQARAMSPQMSIGQMGTTIRAQLNLILMTMAFFVMEAALFWQILQRQVQESVLVETQGNKI